MGGYKTTVPMVYVVGWREAGVIKNGFSERQRWRPFVLRGAELIALYAFPHSGVEAVRFETFLEEKAAMLYRPAFLDKTDEARELLGGAGGGYLECYRADVDDWASIVLKQCSGSNARIYPGASDASTPTYVTDVRTNEEVLSPSRDISPFVTRTRAYGFAEVTR